MRLGDVQAQHIDIIPTGALTLDIALGVGGIPRGRIVEVYGRSRLERRHSPCTSSPRRSAAVASPPSSMPSTRSIHSTRRASG